MRHRFLSKSWALVFWLACGVLAPAMVAWAAEESKEATSDPKEQKEVEVLRKTSQEFVALFNAGKAEGLGALCLETAEVADADGEVIKGRAAIVARFAGVFKESPGLKLQTDITSIRLLTNDVAVEDGTNTTMLNDQKVEGTSAYTIVYLKREGKWMIARIRDFPEEPSVTPHDRLQALAWLVGDWVDESPDSRVETTCRWSEDGNFLIQHYTVTGRKGNELKGTQRIGWDAARRMYRSWIFDNSGGFGESVWVQVNDFWLVRAEGTTADGETGSAMRKIVPLGVDLYEITSSAKIVGGQASPDSVVRVVRRPPKPDGKK